MMRYVKTLAIICVLVVLERANAYTQNQKPEYRCDILEKVLKDKSLDNHFQLSKMNYSISLIDTHNLFKCPNLLYKNNEVSIERVYPTVLKKGVKSYKELSSGNVRIIVLQSIEPNKKGHVIRLWQANDNATVEIFIGKNNKVKVLNIGVY